MYSDLDVEILNKIEYLYNILNKLKNKIFNIKKKLISTEGKLKWKDGEIYIFEYNNIKIIAKNIIQYIEPCNYSDILKTLDIQIIYKNIKKIDILPFLKIKIREAKIEYVLQ